MSCISFCSLQWSSPIYFVVSTLLAGSFLILVAKGDKRIDIWRSIERYRSNVVIATPTIFIDMYYALPSDIDVDCLKVLHSVGEIVPQWLVEHYVKRLPHVNIFNGYGSTELGSITFCNLCDDFYRGKVEPSGIIQPGVKLKVVNESNMALEPNQIGEILVKTRSAMIGYYNNPNSFHEADGFIKTGDLGYYDDDLCVYVIGRKSQAIKLSADCVVLPGIVERIINKHPAVEVSAVVGLMNEGGGNDLTVVVKLKKGAAANAGEIEKFINEQVEDYQRITKGGVRFIDTMPLTYTGKPNRRKLVEKILDDRA